MIESNSILFNDNIYNVLLKYRGIVKEHPYLSTREALSIMKTNSTVPRAMTQSESFSNIVLPFSINFFGLNYLKGRTPNVVMCRKFMAYALSERGLLGKISVDAVSIFIYNKSDHASVIHLIKTLKNHFDTEEDIKNNYIRFENELKKELYKVQTINSIYDIAKYITVDPYSFRMKELKDNIQSINIPSQHFYNIVRAAKLSGDLIKTRKIVNNSMYWSFSTTFVRYMKTVK